MGLILKVKNADFSKNNLGVAEVDSKLRMLNIEGLARWFEIDEKYINPYNSNFFIKGKNTNEYFGNSSYVSLFEKTGINGKPSITYGTGAKGGVIVNNLFKLNSSYTVSFVCTTNCSSVNSGLMLSNNSGDGFAVVCVERNLEVRNSLATKKLFNTFFETNIPTLVTIEYSKDKQTLTVYKNGHIFNTVDMTVSPVSSNVIFLNTGDNGHQSMKLGDIFTFNKVLSNNENEFDLVHNYLKSKYSIS